MFGGKGRPVARAKHLQLLSSIATQGIVTGDALREVQIFDTVAVSDTLFHQNFALPDDAPTIFFIRIRNTQHRADPRLSAFERK
ncbi:hypothetical protein ATY79_24425 [Rhizobium sp. R693]|nr:hypothetical protein ATY79_24425 [Rhizobium sp. R693]